MFYSVGARLDVLGYRPLDFHFAVPQKFVCRDPPNSLINIKKKKILNFADFGHFLNDISFFWLFLKFI